MTRLFMLFHASLTAAVDWTISHLAREKFVMSFAAFFKISSYCTGRGRRGREDEDGGRRGREEGDRGRKDRGEKGQRGQWGYGERMKHIRMG